LAEAIPVPGSGLKLPLDLHAIASRLTNAYYAPKRFAAVQVAFNNGRCRVLVFHTGRLVGTGCAGPMQARLAILKAVRQLAVEAKVYVHIRKFSVINQVGAVSIDAKLDCDAFASTHSATSHYDRASFVGAPPPALPAPPAC
jgi:TATA-box binding protein (TBP) (component of TFIID and TFIIIB)